MSKIHCVTQDGPKDCGISCLLMLIHYYGGNISKEDLRELTHTDQMGVNAYDLLEGAKKIGFQGRGMKGDLAFLDSFMLPCIAHIVVKGKYQHFVVIEEVNQKRKVVIILDPASGRRKLSFSEFEKMSTKQYLYLKPKSQLPMFESSHVIRSLIIMFFMKNKYRLFFILILSCICTILSIVVAFHFKFLLEYVFPFHSFSNATSIALFLSFLILFQLLFHWMRQKILYFLECQLGTVLMDCLVQQIVLLPYPYYKNKTTGEMMSRLNDLEEIKDFFIQLCGHVLVDFLLAVAMLGFLFKFQWLLTVYLLLFVSALVLLLGATRSFLSRRVQQIQEDLANVQTSFVETVSGVETIKGMHLEYFMSDRLNHDYYHFLNHTRCVRFLFQKVEYIKEHILQLGLVFLLWKGSVLVMDGQLSLANLLLFYNFYVYFLEAIQRIFSFGFRLSSMKVSVRRLEELLDVKTEPFISSSHRRLTKVEGDILFDDVSYAYQEHIPLLKHVTFHIRAREKVVLYGPSGSGKSTLAKLLLRYYAQFQGEIQLDHIILTDYALEDIRTHITYVSQNETLFTDTIYHNVVLDQEIDYELFLKVCRITRVDKIVKDHILGYDQVLEENGFHLSGGERQRIVLARTILKKSAVFILDEAFNQIDISLEREILKDLFFFLRDRTILVISHRYDNQDLFDRRLFMEGGTCRESLEFS